MTAGREVLHLDTMDEVVDHLAFLEFAGCDGLSLDFDMSEIMTGGDAGEPKTSSA
jgi:hypothetical protein